MDHHGGGRVKIDNIQTISGSHDIPTTDGWGWKGGVEMRYYKFKGFCNLSNSAYFNSGRENITYVTTTSNNSWNSTENYTAVYQFSSYICVCPTSVS